MTRHRSPRSLSVLARIAALGLAAGLSGCGLAEHSGRSLTHPGVARAYNYPVHGIDVARYQGDINWQAVKASGIGFAYIKATEGGDYVDPMFAANYQGAKAAGLPVGAYHFVYWCRPAHEQALWFKQHIPSDPTALPPVLDLEWNGHSKTCPRKVPREDALEKVRLMLRELEQLTGKRPIIYTDITFHREVLQGEAEFDIYPFWMRSVAAPPEDRYVGRRPSFWQYTATAQIPGIRGNVDKNTFVGSKSEFQAWVSGQYDVATQTWTNGRRPSVPQVAQRSAPVTPVTAEPVQPAIAQNARPAQPAPVASAKPMPVDEPAEE
jgi:lysozyme